MDAKVAFFMVN